MILNGSNCATELLALCWDKCWQKAGDVFLGYVKISTNTGHTILSQFTDLIIAHTINLFMSLVSLTCLSMQKNAKDCASSTLYMQLTASQKDTDQFSQCDRIAQVCLDCLKLCFFSSSHAWFVSLSQQHRDMVTMSIFIMLDVRYALKLCVWARAICRT